MSWPLGLGTPGLGLCGSYTWRKMVLVPGHGWKMVEKGPRNNNYFKKEGNMFFHII